MVKQMSDNQEDKYEENLRKLLSAAHPPVAPSEELKARLLRQLQERIRKEPAGLPDRVVAGLSSQLRTVLAAVRRHPGRLVLSAAAAASVVLIGVALFALAKRPAGPILATLTIQKGTAEVVGRRTAFLILERTETIEAKAGEELWLGVGDRIASGEDSQALLSLFEGSTVQLDPGTELTIGELRPESETSGPLVRLDLERGKTLNDVPRPSYEELDRFVVRTPSTTASAMGTRFTLEVITPEHTFLATVEGIVRITMGLEYVDVYAGEEIDAIVGQPLVVRARRPEPQVGQAALPDFISAREVVLQGHANPGDLVDILLNGVKIATVLADAEGKFSYPLDTSREGAYTVSIRSTNQRGHVSEEVVLMVFTTDFTPPPLVITSPTESEVASSPITLAGQTEPWAQVMLDDQRLQLDSNGSFMTTLELEPGANPFTVVATDQAGNSTTIRLVIILQP